MFAEWLLARFRESRTALLAFEALDLIPTASSFYHFDPAIVARHLWISC